MKPEHPSWWDPHSDQPFKLGQSHKPRFQGANLNQYLQTGLSAAALSPVIAWCYAGSVAVKPAPLTDFVGLGISPDHASHNTMRVFYYNQIVCPNIMPRLSQIF
jgi:hypothetical protein